MHRSEIIRFRCCKSCPENRGSGKCGDLHAELSLSTAASEQRPQGCSFLLQAAVDMGAKSHPSIKQSQRSSSQISGTFMRPEAIPILGSWGHASRELPSYPPQSCQLSPLPGTLPGSGAYLTNVFPFLTSTSLSRIAARLGSSDSTDHIGGTAG